MTHRIAGFLLCFGYCITVAVANEDIVREKESLQGVWILETAEENGALDDQAPKKMSLTFQDDRLFMRFGEETLEVAYDLDPSKVPKQLNFHAKVGAGTETKLCIYELTGDRLKICMGEDERPLSFATQEGSRLQLLTFRRQARLLNTWRKVKSFEVPHDRDKLYWDMRFLNDDQHLMFCDDNAITWTILDVKTGRVVVDPRSPERNDRLGPFFGSCWSFSVDKKFDALLPSPGGRSSEAGQLPFAVLNLKSGTVQGQMVACGLERDRSDALKGRCETHGVLVAPDQKMVAIGWTEYVENGRGETEQTSAVTLFSRTGDPIAYLLAPKPFVKPSQLAFSSDSRYLAATYGDGLVQVWDTSNPARAPKEIDTGYRPKHGFPRFSPDAKQIVALGSSGSDLVAHWIDIESGKTDEISVGRCHRLYVTHDCRYSLVFSGSTATGLNFRTGAVEQVLTAVKQVAGSGAFSADGRVLAIQTSQLTSNPKVEMRDQAEVFSIDIWQRVDESKPSP